MFTHKTNRDKGNKLHYVQSNFRSRNNCLSSYLSTIEWSEK